MDLERLKEFTVLAQAGSFRQAAQTLGVSPALLSSRIAALEEKTGVRLLKRSAHRLELTEAGMRFLKDAKDICAEYSQILSDIGVKSESVGPSLRIGISGFAIPAKLGPYLDVVNLQYPGIRLDILDDSRAGIRDGLESGEFDLFFTYADETLHYEGVEKEPVYSVRVQVLLPLSHHLASRSSVNLADLDGERFVLYPETAEPAARDCERKLLERCGISFSVYEGSVCPAAYFVMVPVGKGIALCPWALRSMVPPNTTAVSVNAPDFNVSMYMFYRRDCTNPYLHEFLDGFRSFNRREAGI